MYTYKHATYTCVYYRFLYSTYFKIWVTEGCQILLICQLSRSPVWIYCYVIGWICLPSYLAPLKLEVVCNASAQRQIQVLNSQLQCKIMVKPQKPLVVYLLDQPMEMKNYPIGQITSSFFLSASFVSNCRLKKVWTLNMQVIIVSIFTGGEELILLPSDTDAFSPWGDYTQYLYDGQLNINFRTM